MPVVKRKASPPTSWRLQLGPAVGTAADFWVLARCPALDEHERRRDPDHGELTHVLRYQLPTRTVVARVPARIEDLWQIRGGPLLGVGEPLGYLEIDPTGAREVALDDVPGTFSRMWGPDADHVFACGSHAPFVLYRRMGQWVRLALPDGVEGLYDVCGRHEREVYFVGDRGVIVRWDGRSLTRMHVPTSAYLTGIVALDDASFCVCGYQGTLLRGNGSGWTPIATGLDADLLSLAALEGKVYFGSDDAVWSFDGVRPPAPAIEIAARWVSGLDDGLVISYADDAWLYRAGALTRLDTSL